MELIDFRYGVLFYTLDHCKLDVSHRNLYFCFVIKFCFHWKFVATEEAILLDYAIREVEHVLSAEVYHNKELAYMKSLTCSTIGTECETRLDLLQSILFSISLWCDSKLHDYHLYFSQVYNLSVPPILFLVL